MNISRCPSLLLRRGLRLAAGAVGGVVAAGVVWAQQHPAEQATRKQLDQHPSLQGRTYSLRWPAGPRWPECSRPLQVNVTTTRDRLWGAVALSVQCPDARAWVRQTSVQVQVQGRYLVAARALPAGQALEESDFEWREGLLGSTELAYVDNAQRLVEAELARPLAPGTPLRLNDLKPLAVIKSGQQVTLTLVGKGFSVVTSATAQGAATQGATVKVKTQEGKIVTGKAVAEGQVEASLE